MKDKIKKRNMFAFHLAVRSGSGQGKHSNRSYDIKKGRSRKAKHKKHLD